MGFLYYIKSNGPSLIQNEGRLIEDEAQL
ncbi:uncharacterized protein G2W53_006007 [Senna tora]|uniref:Uncharacterized protein n=1 Tax=Senna tora TaxID=362788 RepID=A0A835CED6_9FABA|nr:uncharacterized protein G2W53_006007 [Senna tora]